MDNQNVPTLFHDKRWQAALFDYLRHIYERSNSSKSLALYTYYLEQFFSDPARTPDLYTRMEVLEYLHRTSRARNNPGGEPSAATRGARLSILKSYYFYCENYTIPGSNGKPQRLLQSAPPTLGIDQPRRIVNYKALSLDEIRAFFVAVEANPDPVLRARDRAIFTWFLYTTRRRAEIARLKFSDVFQGTIREEDGRSREAFLYIWTGKGDGGQLHTIELPAPCQVALMRYLIASDRIETMKPESALFVGHGPTQGGGIGSRGDTALEANTIYCSWRKYARQAGIDTSRTSLHSFRHSGIQLRLQVGQRIPDVMKVSGHKSLDTFMRYARNMNVSDTGVDLLLKPLDFLNM